MSGQLRLGNYDVFLTEILGQGSFGVVYKGRHKTRGFEIAAKQCMLKSGQQGDVAMTEIKHVQRLQEHPHIVALYDFNYKQTSFWMIMEFCDAGDLEKYVLAKNPEFNEQKNIMFQCASAIHYMHSRVDPAVHRDIKPHNIIMKKHGSGTIAKISDFGLAKTVEITQSAHTLMFNTKCGTPGYMAPEFYQAKRQTRSYGKHVDVFSLGLVFLAMMLHENGNERLAPQTGEIVMPVGQHMANNKQMNVPLPDITCDVKVTTEEHAILKLLIQRMTLCEPQDRVKMAEVESALSKIGGSSPFPLPDSKLKEAVDRRDDKEDELKAKPADKVPKHAKEDTDAHKAIPADKVPTHAKENTAAPNRTTANHSPTDAPGNIGFARVKQAMEKAQRERQGSDKAHLRMPDEIMGNTRLRVGERVMLDADERRVERLQPGYGLWHSSMSKYLGQYGIVTKSHANVQVQFEDEQRLLFNPKLLYGTGEVICTPEELKRQSYEQYSDDIVHDDTRNVDGFRVTRRNVYRRASANLRVGEKVILDTDLKKVEFLQPGYGTWDSSLKQYLGQPCIVKQVAANVQVQFEDGRVLLFHPQLLIRTGEMPYKPEELNQIFGNMSLIQDMFKSTDVVRISTESVEVFKCVQEATPTGWDPGMEAVMGTKGLVNRVKGPEEISVEFLNNDRWVLHPEILQHVKMAEYEIEAGDMVVVQDDKDLVSQLKYTFRNWDDMQMNFLGEPGIVKCRVSGEEVVVDMNGREFSWHPMLLKLWAKAEEVMTAVLKNHRRK